MRYLTYDTYGFECSCAAGTLVELAAPRAISAAALGWLQNGAHFGPGDRSTQAGSGERLAAFGTKHHEPSRVAPGRMSRRTGGANNPTFGRNPSSVEAGLDGSFVGPEFGQLFHQQRSCRVG